jgi:NAD(P)H-nitrite reductase large subunit
MKNIVIIGNGISGITAARHIRKLDNKAHICVISGESDYFFSRTALMYIYMGHLKFEHTKPYEDNFWKKNRIELLKAWVEKIDFQTKTLHLHSEKSLKYDVLIIATGSKPNKFGWKGQDLAGVQGLYSIQDLENLERMTPKIEKAVIIGGGLIGVELAEMLLSRHKKVTFLVREKSFWNSILPKEDSELITKHIQKHHVDLRLSTELDEIIGKNGHVSAIRTKAGEVIDCQFVGLAVGVSPNIDFLKNDTSLKYNKGILVDEYLQTNLPNVYAIGDCAEHQKPPNDRKNIEQIWYTARIMGETVAQTICGNPSPYQPSFFFNSAKFFDIEYQTYGQVKAQLSEEIAFFYWENQTQNKAIRIHYRLDNEQVIGINTFGIRMKHEVWEKWLKDGKTMKYVMENLVKANFDAEFSKRYENEILEKYNLSVLS